MDSVRYINGNYFVTMNKNDGTKTYRALRLDEPILKADFPDSLDIKITNKCRFNCPFCHESSTITGKSFDVDKTISILDTLPKVGIELAIGGGDILEIEKKQLFKFLEWCERNNFCTRATINWKDLLVHGIDEINKRFGYVVGYKGISVSSDSNIIDIKRVNNSLYDVVFHVIVGINPIEQVEEMIKSNEFLSILVLGYKNWGRGKNYKIDESNLLKWKQGIKNIMFNRRINPRMMKSTIGFDNLAIEQLDIRGSMLEEEWCNSYMGDEFTHSMYIDAVDGIFAPTSRDPFRVSWDSMSLLKFFKTYRKEDKLTNNGK